MREAIDWRSWPGIARSIASPAVYPLSSTPLDPYILVLGGGVENIDELYDELPPRLAEETFSPSFYTPIVRALRGDSSGVRGAA
jgi:hypothetical protein